MENQPAPGTVPLEGICGNCLFWAPVELKGPVQIGGPRRGSCYGAPATPIPQYDRNGSIVGQLDMRPCPASDTRMCALFIPRPLTLESDPTGPIS